MVGCRKQNHMAKKKQNDSSKPASEKPRVHKDLDGFDIKINSFGEITTSFDMDRINAFLNKNVDDKKLRDRDDIVGRKLPKGKKKVNEEEEQEEEEE
jgi:hypothetical protein